MKTLLKIAIILSLACGLSACEKEAATNTKIGIVVPLEHTAMNEIIAGFTETLHSLYHQPVTIKVMNAQNDMNLQRAIIQQMRDENYTMIVPIGTSTSQMTLAMIHNQPVVSLAAELAEKDRQAQKPCHVAIVHDEISANHIIAFIHAVYPTITNITLVHSAADKVFPEVETSKAAALKYNIKINTRMATSLPELSTVANSLPEDTQAIFVLKDSLIVSGISILQKVAQQKHILLITSDEGSVKDGAGFALGVPEKEIGIQGAKLAAAVLNGTDICQLPITEMNNLTIFINPTVLHGEGQDPAAIADIANKLHYHLQTVTGG